MVQDISSYGANTQAIQATNDVKTAIAVKMFKESQASVQIAGDIIQDTAEISAKAMQLYQAERG